MIKLEALDFGEPDLSGHSFGVRTPDNPNGICPQCPGEHDRSGRCDQAVYSKKWIRFITVDRHLEARLAAHYDANKQAATNELARQFREFQTLPPRHLCSCVCPKEDLSRGYPACPDCRRLRAPKLGVCRFCVELAPADRPKRCPECMRLAGVDMAIEFGRSGHVVAPMPSVELLDLIAGYMR